MRNTVSQNSGVVMVKRIVLMGLMNGTAAMVFHVKKVISVVNCPETVSLTIMYVMEYTTVARLITAMKTIVVSGSQTY